VVGFNEPVRCTEITTGTPATILRFVDGDGSAQSGTIFDGATIEGSCGGTTKSLRIVLPTPGLISPIDDSLAAVEGVLYDPYNNATPAKRAVVIEWGKAYEAIPIAKNIFSPLEEIPPVILGSLTSGSQAPPKTGTMIEILSVRPIVTEKSHAAVYDAVGNVVRTGLPVYEVKGDRSRYWQFWDGKNTAGRMVGTGTYLTVITLQLNDGTTSQTKLKLGVKR
jgi:hypothetical protein